ncbi:hypothetical protein M406DRAFT_49278 [Cryphonectria parasitica EP155]|uniref:DASH complex subunit SPC34 n=1 Tax=Cryphonectria parasitica (strain ATCC 38755 / EP155) TaxID=660469 RepID=A0A9P4XYC0_CRYP1|nr:uncharacterized protein M406DRAFT_49278 [Cryphonectria parasitica EP155]KAF3763030.1 hypothetical protein M406DRAFT_49278 [Cryphonectria parasitica EP155]
MSLLAAHLEQITFSCQGIDSLPFPPPKIFTNALLSNHDITSLIRDTEAHERALFSVPAPPPPSTQQQQEQAARDSESKSSSRRQTVFNVTAGEVTTGPPTSRGAGNPRRNTAVAAVLGGEMHATITRRAPASQQREGAGDVELEVLLRGAEKLCHVYPLPGALERIPTIRQRWSNQAATLGYYEAKVAEQTERLGRMNKRDEFGADQPEEDEDEDDAANDIVTDSMMTEEDLRKEEEEVRELEKKKRELQARLRAMDRDLGGLLNM